MKSKLKKTVVALGVGVIILGTTASFSEPGSERDPLVTMTYVDKKIEEVKSILSDKIIENKQEIDGSSSNELQIIEVSKNQSIILDKGSEAILRSGSAKAISKITNGVDNGLSDLTAGMDLKMDQEIKLDHLLLTPRGDGRGAKVTSDSIFLVRGVYEIR